MKEHRVRIVNARARSNVVVLPVDTRLDLPPERVLVGALNAGMTQVVVVGLDRDGNEYVAASQADGADVLWHLRRAEGLIVSMPRNYPMTVVANPEGHVPPFPSKD